MAYPCPCCAHFTMPEAPPGTFDTCPVCGWEDDHIQFNLPTLADGANPMSLDDARRNYKEFGAASRSLVRQVRRPTADEKR